MQLCAMSMLVSRPVRQVGAHLSMAPEREYTMLSLASKSDLILISCYLKAAAAATCLLSSY